MPLGPALGGLGVGAGGLRPQLRLTFAAVVLSGIGVAAFHPEGSRFANYVSGARRASGMSLFSVGGNVGFALGPVLVTPLVLVFGLPGTAVRDHAHAADGRCPGPRAAAPAGFRSRPARRARPAPSSHDAWGPFAMLAAVIALRSFVYFGLVTFIPLYYVHVLHTSKALGQRGADGDAASAARSAR